MGRGEGDEGASRTVRGGGERRSEGLADSMVDVSGSKKRKTSGEERGDDEEAEVGLRSDFFSALPMDLMYQVRVPSDVLAITH